MKKILFSVLVALAAAIIPSAASAAEFFDTSAPENLMTLGVRLGVNTSNRNLNKDVFDRWNCNSWGTGVDVGVVANINFRDWFSIQPGLFYESRSGKFSYINLAGYDSNLNELLYTQYGRDRSYSLLIPIMACAHFNISDDIRWNVEAGPYVQLVLKNTVNGEFAIPEYTAGSQAVAGYHTVNSTKADFGIKFGTSLQILEHYSVGVHYEAGMLKPWEDATLGGRRKAWVFSLGYDF